RLLRQLVRDRLHRGDVAGPVRSIRGRVGWRADAQGGADPCVGESIRRPAERGAAAAVGPDAQPGGTALELAEIGADEQLRRARCPRTRRACGRRTCNKEGRSGVPEELVPCLGTATSPDITFLTLSNVASSLRDASRR